MFAIEKSNYYAKVNMVCLEVQFPSDVNKFPVTRKPAFCRVRTKAQIILRSVVDCVCVVPSITYIGHASLCLSFRESRKQIFSRRG